MADGFESVDEDEAIARINIIPFVDVVLVLLIIFLLTSNLIAKGSIPVDLPQAAAVNQAVDSTVNIVVTANGSLFLDGNAVSADALRSGVTSAYQHDARVRAVIALLHGAARRVHAHGRDDDAGTARSSRSSTDNGGGGSTKGLEVSAQQELWHHLDGWLFYIYSVADIAASSGANAYVAIAGTSLGDRTPAYQQLDLRVDKTWTFPSWAFTAYLDVRNVTNHKNVASINAYNFDSSQAYYRTSLPILPLLGARADFWR